MATLWQRTMVSRLMSLPNRRAVASKSPTNSSAITNNPLSRWPGTSAIGRRCRDLFKGYLSQLSNPTDPPTQALVLAAAEQVVIAELARRECLTNTTDIKINSMIRAENTANRSLKRLGLNKAASKPTEPTLAEYLAKKPLATPVALDDEEDWPEATLLSEAAE